LEDDLPTKKDDIIPRFKTDSETNQRMNSLGEQIVLSINSSESKEAHYESREPAIYEIFFIQSERFPTGCDVSEMS